MRVCLVTHCLFVRLGGVPSAHLAASNANFHRQWRDSALDFKSFLFLTWITSVFLLFSFPLFVACDFLRHSFYAHSSLHPPYKTTLHAKLGPVRDMPRGTLAAASLSTLFLFFFSTYLWYLNLDMVPVSISFALSHVLLMSWWLLRTRITWRQAAVLACLAVGLALIASGAQLLATLCVGLSAVCGVCRGAVCGMCSVGCSIY